MKIFSLCASVFLFPVLFAESSLTAARVHYDNGDYGQALRLYRSAEGRSAALDYNIGNTLMRLDRVQEAIAYYRRAQWQKPGDPDIQANLKLAADTAGAGPGPLPVWRKLFGGLSPLGWQRGFVALCWLTAGLGIAGLKWKPLRERFLWIFPLLILGLGVFGAGVWAGRPSAYFHEAVVLPAQITARFEPLPDSTERFPLTGGAVVSVLQTERNWVRITLSGESGWVEKDQLAFLREL